MPGGDAVNPGEWLVTVFVVVVLIIAFLDERFG